MSEKHSTKFIDAIVLCTIIALAIAMAFLTKRRQLLDQINAENEYKIEVIKTFETLFNEESKNNNDTLSIRYAYYLEKPTGVDIYYNVYKDDYLRGKINVTMSNWDCEDLKVYKEWLY